MSEARPTRRAWGLAARMGMLLVVSVAIAAAVNAARPSQIAWVEAWSNRVEIQALESGIGVVGLEETAALADEGLAFVFDARPADIYAAGHLPLALSFPSENLEETFALHIAPLLIPEQAILVYCTGQLCDESLTVARFLVGQGFTNVVLFADGYDAWLEAGLPIEEGL